jgi:hypothetical protein
LSPFSDDQVYYLGYELVALLVGAYALVFIVRRLSASRAGLAIGAPIAVAFAVRLLAAIGLDQTSIAVDLRGGDEFTFLSKATAIAHTGIGSEPSTDALTSQLQIFFFSVFKRIAHPTPPFMLRILVIAIAVAGIAFLATAVWELAGPGPAALAAWIVALEPTHVFFSGILHKEPFMFLAEGLLVFGGAKLWKRGELSALIPLVLGCLIAIATRPYVGWFFVAAAAAVVLGASITHRRAQRALALLAAAVLLVAVFVPVAWEKSSRESLRGLQSSQDANASDAEANLALERVDYSTRGDVILNLPQRIRDVILRPYPWQVANTSQRLGVLGTIVMFVGLLLLASALIRSRGEIMRRAGPLIYPALFALVAYSLSAGNAGTAYRYRTHVVAMMLCALVLLREQRSEEQALRADARRQPSFRPVPDSVSAT